MVLYTGGPKPVRLQCIYTK